MMKFYLFTVLFFASSFLVGQEMFPLNSVHSSNKKPLQIHVKDECAEKSFLATHMPKGTIYLVSVWATWCGPCRAELNALKEIHFLWTEKYNFEFIALSIDKPTDHSKVFEMADRMNWGFKILHDEYGYVSRELGVSAIPRMFLVNQKGEIVYEPKGFNKSALNLIEQKIEEL